MKHRKLFQAHDVIGSVADDFADEWARRKWSQAVCQWRAYRAERLFYRERVLRPCLRALVGSLRITREYLWADIGCGDAEESAYLARLLRVAGASQLRWLGIDRESDLLADGRRIAVAEGAQLAMVDLRDGRALERCVRGVLARRIDLLSAFYSLHDFAGAEITLATAGRNVRQGGVLLASVVNPYWIQRLIELGVVRIWAELAPLARGSAKWVGEFDMIKWNGEGFALPYFHRTVDDYVQAFWQAGFEVESQVYLSVQSPLRRSRAPSAEAWPGSDKVPTSVVFLCRKRRTV